MRTGEHAREQKPDNGRNPQLVAGHDDRAGQAKDHDGIGQNGNLDAHALLLLKLVIYSRADDRLP